MGYTLEHGSHSVFRLFYHLVFVVKYRRKIFNNERIIDGLKQIWMPLYFLASTRQGSLDIVKNYIENQGKR